MRERGASEQILLEFPQMNARRRRILFRVGLIILTVAFIGALFTAYREQQQASLTATLILGDERKERTRIFSLVLTGQEPRESLFDGQLFIGLGDLRLSADQLVIQRAPSGRYAKSVSRSPLVRDPGFGLRTNVLQDQFPSDDLGHLRFPFDNSELDLTFAFEPPIPIEAVSIVNRVPGFVMPRASAAAERKADGSLRIKILLRRNYFTQVLCGLVLIAGITFALLILAAQAHSTLGSSVAAFFFSLWSLRGVLSSQIQTFPTLFDYGIVLLCAFMLAGLMWRIITRQAAPLDVE